MVGTVVQMKARTKMACPRTEFIDPLCAGDRPLPFFLEGLHFVHRQGQGSGVKSCQVMCVRSIDSLHGLTFGALRGRKPWGWWRKREEVATTPPRCSSQHHLNAKSLNNANHTAHRHRPTQTRPCQPDGMSSRYVCLSLLVL